MAYAFPITIPAASVGAALTNFPCHIALDDSRIPSGFWANLVHNNGGDIRIRTTQDIGSAEIPLDLVWIDSVAEDGDLFFRVNLSDSVDTEVWVHYGDSDNTLYTPSIDELTVTNPSAETDVTGWTNTSGTLTRKTSSPTPPYSDAGYFTANNAAQCTAYQDISVPGGHVTAVDAGERAIRLTWLQANVVDKCEMRLEFFDGSAGSLGSSTGSGLHGSDTLWDRQQWQIDVPANTRTIRVFMNFVRSSGTENNGYISNIHAFLVQRTPTDSWSVWNKYAHIYLMGATGFEDRTGTRLGTSRGGARLYNIVSQSTDLGGHQGMAIDPANPETVYVIDTNAIRKFDVTGMTNGTYAGATWTLDIQNTNPVGDSGVTSANHCSDSVWYDDHIIIPISQFVNVNSGANMHLVRFDPSDLSFVDKVDISAQGNFVSGICYKANVHELFTCAYREITDDESKRFRRYNPDTLAYIGTLELSRTIPLAQGIEWFGGYFWVSSDDDGGIYPVMEDGTVLPAIFGGGTAFTEGISNNGINLCCMLDNGGGGDIIYEIDNTRRNYFGGGAAFPGILSQRFYNVPKSIGTTWSLGVTGKLNTDAGTNRALLGWDNQFINADAARAGLYYRNATDQMGIWDNNNSWLHGSGTHTAGTEHRHHFVYSATTQRRLYRDGVLVATDNTITAKPGSVCDSIGLGSVNASDRWVGDTAFWWVAFEDVGDDWMAAEYDNLYDAFNFLNIGNEEETGSISVTNELILTQDIATTNVFNRSIEHELTLVQAVDTTQQLEHMLVLNQDAVCSLSHAVEALNNIVLDQSIINSTAFNREVEHTLTLVDTALRVFVESVPDTLSLTHDVEYLKIRNVSASGTLTLTQSADREIDYSRTMHQGMTINQTVARNLTRNPSASHTLTLTSTAVGVNTKKAANTLTLTDEATVLTGKHVKHLFEANSIATVNKTSNRSAANNLIPFQVLARNVTYNRTVPQTLALTHTLTGFVVRPTSNVLVLTHSVVANKTRPVSSELVLSNLASVSKTTQQVADSFLEISEVLDLSKSYAGSASSVWSASHFAKANLVITRLVDQNLNLMQDLVRDRYIETVPQTLDLDHSAEGLRILPRSMTQSLNLTHSVAVAKTLVRAVTHTLVFPPTHQQYLGFNGQTYVDVPNVVGVKVHPLVVLQYGNSVITLKAPEFNDSEAQSGRINIKRAMDGTRRVYKRESITSHLVYEFVMDRMKAIELRSFILANNSNSLTMTNWKGEIWAVQLANNPFSFEEDAFRGGPWGDRSRITLEFDGVRLN